MEKDIVYHGTTELFDEFSLDHLFEGDGKSKFGLGINVSEVYKTAGNYSFNKSRRDRTHHYVYTLEVPHITPDNHLFSRLPVAESIVRRTEEKLGEKIPEIATKMGKSFRLYVGNRVSGADMPLKKMIEKRTEFTEQAAHDFFNEIGIVFFAWPTCQTKIDGPTNRAVLDTKNIRILKIDEVQLDEKNKYIIGSEKEVKL